MTQSDHAPTDSGSTPRSVEHVEVLIRSLEPNQVLVLCALRDGARRAPEIKRPVAATRNAALTSLAAAGLVQTRKEGRTVLLQLTPDGSRAAVGLEAPAPAAPARGRVTSHGVRSQIVASLEELRRAVARIEARLDDRPSHPAAAAAAVDASALRAAILSALRELDSRHRYGGLVPIPDLRRALAPLGLAPPTVDEALEALERDFVIDLGVAQAPSQVADSALGILRPGRGLLYYVARRADS